MAVWLRIFLSSPAIDNNRLSMQYQSPRYEGDIGKAYAQLVACRSEVRASLSTETLREAYVHFFGDLQRRTEVSLVSHLRCDI